MKSNDSKLNVIIVTLVVLVLGLISYIAYDKALSSENNPVEDTQNGDKDNNGEITDTDVNYEELTNEVKNKFDFVFNYYSSVIAYCGEFTGSDVEYRGGNMYNVSTEYTTYDEMYSKLKEYMSDEVISAKTAFSASNKDYYLEKDNKLYCATFGKGGIYSYGDTIIEIKSIEDDKITAVAIKEIFGDVIKTYEKVNLTLEKENNNYIITSYEVQD